MHYVYNLVKQDGEEIGFVYELDDAKSVPEDQIFKTHVEAVAEAERLESIYNK